jgi:ubiquinone/menaquinone biosynthesis C-methylase UbiE
MGATGGRAVAGTPAAGRGERTRRFYDSYWPANVPDAARTREHVFSLLGAGDYDHALDGGCGTGVCSLALAERARRVTSIDLSGGSLRTARGLADDAGRSNLRFVQTSLLALPFPDRTFDLAWSWGVIHHTTDPLAALGELVRVMRPGGTLVLAVYLKTRLTWLQEAIRMVCLRMPRPLARAFIAAVAAFVALAERLGKRTRARDDNPRIASQVEDWFFVPEKHFYSIPEMARLFAARGLSFELLCPRTGRFKSSSNFIVRGVKR